MKNLSYTTKSRPTTYQGINFRSELEAAWASYFDLRQIGWDYEPLLDLKAWRPDFEISVPSCDLESDQETHMLAEVKPYLSKEQWLADKCTLEKIAASFTGEFRVLLLGSSPIVPANFIWGLGNDTDEHEDIELVVFGESHEDWKRAKNTVRWKP